MIELIMTGSWIVVACKEKELFCIENPMELEKEEIERAAKKIRELAGEKKERKFREFMNRLKEYKEKTRKIKEMEKELDEIYEEIQRVLGETEFRRWIGLSDPKPEIMTEFISVPMIEFGGLPTKKWILVEDKEAKEKLQKLSERFWELRERIKRLEEETPRIRLE